MAELIIKDMQLYHEIVDSYNFKTEKLHIDLMAAVNNFYKVQDDVTKENFLGKSKVHRAVPARVDYDQLAPYFLYRSQTSDTENLGKYDSIGKSCGEHSAKTTFEKLFLNVEAP